MIIMTIENFEIIGDMIEELREIQYQEFLDEVNWLFTEALETN